MKTRTFLTVLLTTIFLVIDGTLFSQEKKPSESVAKHLNVLAIGNSFSVCLTQCFPQVVESVPGFSVTFDHLTIGGCTLERHWGNIEKEKNDPGFKYFKKYTYAEKLRSKKWDIVSIQQASPFSMKGDSYFPFARNLYNFIRANCPQAEIVFQQTWSYRPDAPRFSEWQIDQDEMYKRLSEAYCNAARELNVRQIPVGLAMQIARKSQPGGYDTPSCLPSHYVYPNLPDMSRYYIGGKTSWDKDHQYVPGDTIHLNARGKYLQACVWFAVLYERAATEVSFVPKGLSAEDADFIRHAAQNAVIQFKQVNHRETKNE